MPVIALPVIAVPGLARPVLVAVLAVLPVAVLVTVLLVRSRRHRGWLPGTARWSAVAEVGAVVGTVPWLVMTLLPNPRGTSGATLVPFQDLAELSARALVVQVVGNLAVFAAAGALLPVRWARRESSPYAVLLSVAVGAAVCATAVEVLQHVLRLGRVSSVDDVLLNTAGAVLAAAASRSRWGAGRMPVAAPRCGAVAGRNALPARPGSNGGGGPGGSATGRHPDAADGGHRSGHPDRPEPVPGPDVEHERTPDHDRECARAPDGNAQHPSG